MDMERIHELRDQHAMTTWNNTTLHRELQKQVDYKAVTTCHPLYDQEYHDALSYEYNYTR